MVNDITGLETPGMFLTKQLNPGLSGSFPWLSAIANRFETYTMNSFEVMYIPAVGTDTAGALTMAPDYDAADDNHLSTKRILLSFEDSVRGPLWETFSMISRKVNLQKRKTYFVRHAGLGISMDIKMYDFGSLSVFLSNPSALHEEPIGEIWFKYDITFQTPQIEPHSDDLLIDNKDHATTTEDEPFGLSANSVTETGNKLMAKLYDGSNLEIYKPGHYFLSTLLKTIPVTEWITSLGEMVKSTHIWANSRSKVTQGLQMLSYDNDIGYTEAWVYAPPDTSNDSFPCVAMYRNVATTDHDIQETTTILQGVTKEVYDRGILLIPPAQKIIYRKAEELMEKQKQNKIQSELVPDDLKAAQALLLAVSESSMK
jgi:hypothetical protein